MHADCTKHAAIKISCLHIFICKQLILIAACFVQSTCIDDKDLRKEYFAK